MKIEKAPIPLIVPNPDDPRLTERVRGTDQTGADVEIRVPVERPLTLYLNAQEIVTMMTIGDYPEYLALGYLLNQNMLNITMSSPRSNITMTCRWWWCAPSTTPTLSKS